MLASSQNLVPNGDFETYTLCPDYVSQIDRAEGWFRPTDGTSDYFNACLGVPFSMNVPDNQFGDEMAHSGNGYAGFYCFHEVDASTVPGDDDHEYVTRPLSTPLIPGKTYSAEFFISLADVSKYAVDDIGMLFSTEAPYRNDELRIESEPQIKHGGTSWLDEKNGWTRISGCFIADSAYRFITIGNFHDGANTAFLEVPTNYPLAYYSYYYVDDVRAIEVERPELGPDITTCDHATLVVLEPVPDPTNTWSTGETGDSIIVESPGVYWVNVNVEGCIVADTIEVSVLEPIALQLPADTLVDLCSTPFIVLTSDGSPVGASALWSTGATTPSIAVNAPGIFSLSVSAPGYCPAAASIVVVDTCVTPTYAPNAFTPNGDGINDQWRPVWSANIHATLEFTIYDRWGRVLFGTGEGDGSWDGTAHGEPVPIGVYTWHGRGRDPATTTDRIISGHVTVVR